MNKIIIQDFCSPQEMTQICKDKDFSIETGNTKLHGKLIIHYAHGVPRKVEFNNVKDILQYKMTLP